jgi:hypothetical protein
MHQCLLNCRHGCKPQICRKRIKKGKHATDRVPSTSSWKANCARQSAGVESATTTTLWAAATSGLLR